jgi:hypothetical protein
MDAEKKLAGARVELRTAQERLATSIAHDKELTEQRLPLVRAAKIDGDKQAQKRLDALTRDQFEVQQEITDLRAVIDGIEQDIIGLERDAEIEQREFRLDQLRAMMHERAQVATRVQKLVEELAKSVSEYMRQADDASALMNELELPNVGSRALLGGPLIKDFLRHRLHFIFPSELGGYTDAAQRIALTQAEENAQQALEFAINNKREAA